MKVEAEVAASRSYGRSRTEINHSNIAGNTGISDAENINRDCVSCKVGAKNVANVDTEVVASRSHGRTRTEIYHSNIDGIEIDAKSTARDGIIISTT